MIEADVIELGHSSQPSRFPRSSSAKHTHFSRPLFVAATNMDHVFWMATLRKTTMVSLSTERDCRVSRSNGPAGWISVCKSSLTFGILLHFLALHLEPSSRRPSAFPRQTTVSLWLVCDLHTRTSVRMCVRVRTYWSKCILNQVITRLINRSVRVIVTLVREERMVHSVTVSSESVNATLKYKVVEIRSESLV